ncbi:MAG: sodium-translocating pyrophosphatase [Candidatus Sumerlaeota bacterium]|nr:sodium-translocating pyrophosphatase [Candidatus Sumerlaeota bacterium]
MDRYFYLIMLISIGSLAVAGALARWVLAKDTGTEKMRVVSDAIKEGAEAFLKRQYGTIGMLSVVLAVILFAFYAKVKGMDLAYKTVVSFLFGAACSAIAGFIGMFISIRANIRTASAATKNLNTALQIALRGGAVSGILVVAMSLLGVGLLFWIMGGLQRPDVIPLQIVGYGFGASFVALFAQLGGGIYTKAADVGADLVGKVEAGIPEDDPRNPAVIADLVGDNVGDCAGRGADLFESTAAENIGAMILGIALYKIGGKDGPVFGIGAILFPLFARALGLIASILGVLSVRVIGSEEKGWEDPMKSLNRGYFVTTVLAIIGFYVAVKLLLQGQTFFFLSGLVGILCSYAFVWITQYYTEYRYRPVKWIADSCRTGPATTIIAGLSVGMECTALPILVIAAALMLSYKFGQLGMLSALGGWGGMEAYKVTPNAAGLYGTAIATMGMLSTAAYILAMDTFGPITDNAGGIVEMSEQPKEIRVKTDRLDAVGNTTKALTKGYAVGSAALAAFLLFQAYIDEANEYLSAAAKKIGAVPQLIEHVDLGHVPVFVGGAIGAMLVFLFSALAIRAVGRTAQTIILEVRRQFRENPGIMAGTSKPDYARCVDIVTRGALKAMIAPGILPVLVPTALGFGLKFVSKPGTAPQSVAALLMVGTIVGILMALFMNNSGGAWDNAKKFIETGQYGGKGSDAHKAAVVGDTVGDPFKDTAGPSLHVLIKLLSTVTLVLAPLFI